MKKAILFLTLVLFGNIYLGQTKYSIKQEISDYADSVIEATTYVSDKVTFRRHVFTHFISNNFTIESYNDSVYVFSKYFRVSNSSLEKNIKELVQVNITQNNGVFSISSEALWNKSHQSKTYYTKTMKRDIKAYLYIMYNGKGLDVPEYLQEKIKIFNSKKAKDRDKLIEGKDY